MNNWAGSHWYSGLIHFILYLLLSHSAQADGVGVRGEVLGGAASAERGESWRGICAPGGQEGQGTGAGMSTSLQLRHVAHKQTALSKP